MSLSPLPDVGFVTRQPSRNNEDRVDPKLVPGAHEAGGKPLGGDRHPAEPVRVERECGIEIGGPGLYLDEGERSSPASDDVDLAAGNPRAPGKDSPPLQTQPPGSNILCAPAAPFGSASVHPDRSSARA